MSDDLPKDDLPKDDLPKDLPTVLLVMGVSGSGKTRIGELLASRLHWGFEDGDWFHPASNLAKMRAGQPLTEADRAPWLQAIAARIDEVRAAGQRTVVACSALRRSYRELLIGPRPDVGLVYLAGTPELIRERLANRTDHFMPATLLASQLETLEEPGDDEHAITVSIDALPSEIVEAIVKQLRVRS